MSTSEKSATESTDIANLAAENGIATAQEDLAKKPDNKSIVTPYAFGVSDHLLNHPLASPSRRLCAMIFDLICIAILSTLNATFLAGLAAFTFVRANIKLARQRRFKRTRIALSVVIAFLLYFVVYGIVDALTGIPDGDDYNFDIDSNGATIYAAKFVEYTGCKDFECKRELTTELSEEMASTSIPNTEYQVMLIGMIENDASLPEFEGDMLRQEGMDVFDRARQDIQDRLAATEEESAAATNEAPEHQYSVFQWIMGTIKDFGIGFGWAALYFSALPTYFSGATPGKRLFGIYVVRLDGRTPSLWENFGRYGGYTAGFATGLMGFLQVLWDPNRQAIQDKISETLVLRKQR